MKYAIFFLTLLLGLQLFAYLAWADSPVSGSAYVRDADTIVVSGVPVRFDGVDAPELGTAAGRDAKRWLVGFLRDRHVSCDLTGAKTYDRFVGTCFVSIDGALWDVSAAVIASGNALDCARYSGGRYAGLETASARSRLRRSRYC